MYEVFLNYCNHLPKKIINKRVGDLALLILSFGSARVLAGKSKCAKCGLAKIVFKKVRWGKILKTFVSACVSPKSICVRLAKNYPSCKSPLGFLLAESVKLLRHCLRRTVVLQLGITVSIRICSRLRGTSLSNYKKVEAGYNP